jgi:hypothetical protein
MIRLLLLLFIASQPAVSKDLIPIITRNGPTSTGYITTVPFINKLNSIQDRYEFVLQTVSGAHGEAADQKAIAMARSGRKVLWTGPISSFTVNRFEVGNTYDRDNDFFFITSLATTPFSLVTHPDDTSKNVDDFFNSLKKKKEIFLGATMEAGSTIFLSNILLKNYNTKATILRYKDFTEVGSAIHKKEADYTIYVSPTNKMLSLKEILNSGKGKNSGIEFGISDFESFTSSSFATPKELKDFGLEVKPYFDQLCNDKDIIDMLEKYGYLKTCFNDEEMKKRVAAELKMLEKNK